MYDLDNLSWAVQENRPEIVRRGRARVASGIDQRLSYMTRCNSIRGPAVLETDFRPHRRQQLPSGLSLRRSHNKPRPVDGLISSDRLISSHARNECLGPGLWAGLWLATMSGSADKDR